MDGVRPFTIMLEDTEVMRVDFETLKYEVVNEKYLPYPIKGKLREMPDHVSIKSSYDMTCRAVSVSDSYWLKFDDDEDVSWSKVDVKQNPQNEVVAQVALHGKSLTLQSSLITPELTANGAYAKAWRRHPDGKLWLLLRYADDGDSGLSSPV